MEIQGTVSIDSAIGALQEQIKDHQNSARKILYYVVYFVSFVLILGSALFIFSDTRAHKSVSVNEKPYVMLAPVDPMQLNEVQQAANTTKSSNGMVTGINNRSSSDSMSSFGGSSSVIYPPNTTILYVFVLLFVVVFGVMMAVYRFHLSEISRYSQLKFGFLRILIAANNFGNAGFSTEVRLALTKDAFKFQTGKEQRVESPLPGHPTADIGALLLNKILESLDVKVKKKGNPLTISEGNIAG